MLSAAATASARGRLLLQATIFIFGPREKRAVSSNASLFCHE
jgi:hypothetical protein